MEYKQDDRGWQTRYKFRKNNGKWTKLGLYTEIFDLGNGQYAISPYYTDKDEWFIGSAAQVLKYLAVK